MNLKSKLRNFKKNESGQSMVELALVTPILILILCLIVDFGWIFSNKMILSHVTREGSRYGAVNATIANASTQIESRVRQRAPEYIRDEINIVIVFTDIYDVRSGDVEVEVTYLLRALTPIAGIIFGSQDIHIEAKSIMKVE